MSVSHRKITICNSKSKLNKIPFSKNIFSKKAISAKAFRKLFSRSYIMHVPDGLKFDAFSLANYKIAYNKKHNIGINKLLKAWFKGELISFENLSENFTINEKNIYSLLLPIYYTGVPSAVFNLWPVKDKINQPFWNSFYSEKSEKLIDKYSKSSAKLYKANNNISSSYFKVLYGNFGTDRDYKVSILSRKAEGINENIKSETDITNRIFYINNLLQTMDELNSLKADIDFNAKIVYTNLISLYMKIRDFNNALGNLSVLISLETNRIEKEKFQNQYTNIFTLSQMTNNDVDKFNSFIETGDTFYTNKDYDEAVEHYKKAAAYLGNSTLKGYKGMAIYKLSLSLVEDDNLKQAKIWLQKGFNLPKEETNKELKDKFYFLSAKTEFLDKNYNKALTLLTNIRKKDKDFYSLKVQALLKTDVSETVKHSQATNIIAYSITNIPGPIKEILNPVIDYYKDKKNNLYYFINKFKNAKKNSNFDLTKIQQNLPAGSVLIDFYMSDNYIYSILITKKALFHQQAKQGKFKDIFLAYSKSIQENNEEEFNDTKKALFKLLFKDIQENMANITNIIIYPDETLYFINYYNLNKNNLSISNKHITIIKSYNSLNDKEKKAFSFQAFGIQKNLPGKLITDFSYKEVRELEKYFKDSHTEINPLEIKIDETANSFHIAMPVAFLMTNIILFDENNSRNYNLAEMFRERYSYLMLLTKVEYKEFNSHLIDRLNAENLILSLWRNNDALSAIFIRNFYSYLSLYGSIDKAYRISLQKMMGSFRNELAWNSFILIQ